jgi:glycosyltransferase involved in cell wall biosynthesis
VPVPAITVLLPARNAERTVRRALGSVLCQTFTDFEVLAIDDGSTDATGALLGTSGDARVRVITTPGLGLVGALNLGLAQAQAPLIARMDADDESLPGRFDKSLAALEDRSLTGVGTGVDIVRDDHPTSPNLQAYGAWLNSLTTPEQLFADRFVESPLCHPSVMLRTGPLRDLGGWRDGPFPEDWDLWLRLLEGGHRLRCVGEVLHRWFDHDARLTRTDPRYQMPRLLALKADVLARRFAGRSLTIWGAGEIGVRLTRALVERGLTVTHLIDLNPRKIGQTIHGARVVTPEALHAPGDEPLLAAVGAKGARAEIRAWLSSRGWVEGTHFTCVA